MNDHRISRMKCPSCLKYFKSAFQLVAHCDAPNGRCQISKADDYNIFLDRVTGGFLSVKEKIRPDHLNTQSALVMNAETGRMERFTPPTPNYLEYTVTTPPDYKEPIRVAKVIGGFPSRQKNPW